MLDLESAIKHCEEVAEEQDMKAGFETDYQCYQMSDVERNQCKERASECKQIVEWLRELERYRKVRRILSQNRIATGSYGEVVLWDDIKRVLTEVQDADSN